MSIDKLPVAGAMGELRAALDSRATAVLVAPPGAGKTTAAPLALLHEPWLAGRRIVMLEPRRLAARAAARRMAHLLGEDRVGGTVGYRMRGATRVGPSTRIEVVTEGVLPRMLQSDPAIEGVGLVIFDEFHERSLAADLGLALTLHARALLRADLRVLVMSATLDAAPVAALLGDGSIHGPVVEAKGREYPVEIRHASSPTERRHAERAVASTVRAALKESEGDVLVFLPGAAEIRRAGAALRGASLPPQIDVVPLFGNLTQQEQDRAIVPSPPGRRKVVLATTIAQTSLTIEGVRVVVDVGWTRVPRFDPRTGMSRLETVRVTRDAADQRAGRAGRTAPGTCYRLWTTAEDRGLVPQMRPEILEADLAALALDLAAWGAEPSELRWLDAPPEGPFEQAVELLRELDAVDSTGAITSHGRAVARLGLHPRLAHMLIRAGDLGLAPLACDVAALWGERDMMGRGAGADLRLRVEALGKRASSRDAEGARHRIREESRRLRRALRRPERERATHGMIDGTGALVALAYPDRIGQRRAGERGRFLLRNGRGAFLPADDALAGEDWIVVSDAADSGSEAKIYQAASITLEQIEDLFGDQIARVDEISWDGRERRVQAVRQRRLGALLLASGPLPDPDPGAVALALADGVRSVGLRVLPWSRRTEQLRDRLQFLHLADPEGWPDFSEEGLQEELEAWLGPFTHGLRRLDDLGKVKLTDALLARAGWQRRQQLDELAPTHLEVPSGSRVALDYSDPAAPALAARIQELFGWTETPRVGGGRVPLTIRLLSPAQRPVQVTTDLASFWREAYFEVRKDLRGRYPKHYWPEDPLTAAARRGTRPPKG